MRKNKVIYTIGYSPFKIKRFTEVLKQYEILCVIDVRSNPYSKMYPEYNKNNLENELKQMGILYRNYKTEFGAKQTDLKYFSNDKYLDFNKYSESCYFKEGIRKIEEGMALNYVFVLMCSEKDPIICHRNIMVAKAFYGIGYEIRNILADGKYEKQDSIEQRLVDIHFKNKNQIALSEEFYKENVRESYKLQNKKIGYKKEQDSYGWSDYNEETTVHNRIYAENS